MFIMLITEMRDKILPRKHRFCNDISDVQAHVSPEKRGPCAWNMRGNHFLLSLPILLRQVPVCKLKKIKIPPALTGFCLICNAEFGYRDVVVLHRREMPLPWRSPDRAEPLREGRGRRGGGWGDGGRNCPRTSDDTK